MTREEMLERLHGITFSMDLTYLTSEECLELVTMTSDGTTYQWIGFDEWNVFELRGMDQECWNIIREKILNETLSLEDIKGTDLEKLIGKKAQDETFVFHRFFHELSQFSESCPEFFYCIRDDFEEPCFFESMSQLKEALAEIYESTYAWEDYDDDDLEHWLKKYESSDGVACICFTEP